MKICYMYFRGDYHEFWQLYFDFDGTLANSKQCSIEATKEAFAQFGLSEPSDADIVHYMGIPIEKSFIEMSDLFNRRCIKSIVRII